MTKAAIALSPRPSRMLLLYGFSFLSGFVVMSLEMLGSRVIAPWFGNGIYCWAGLITTVLLALALGYFVGGSCADRWPSTLAPGIAFVAASAWLVCGVITGDHVLERLFDSVPDPRVGILIASFYLLLLPLALLSCYTPYMIRLLFASRHNSGRISGRIYGLSTLGSIAGTLVTTFVLIPSLGTRRIILIMAALCSFSGLLLVVFWLRERVFFRTMRVFMALPTLLFLAGSTHGEELDVERIRALPDGILAEAESAYSSIYVRKNSADDTISLGFRRRGQRFLQSVRYLHDDLKLVSYAQAMTLGVVYCPEPDDVLVLGFGGGRTSNYLRHYFPATRITAVELDKAVVELAKTYFGVNESERFKIRVGDARVYLRRSSGTVDIVLIDVFLGGMIPFHLLTSEFYQLVAKRLKPAGCVVVHLHGNSRLLHSSLKTLEKVFLHVDTYSARGSVVAIASSTEVSTKSLERTAKTLQREYKFRHDLRVQLRRRKRLRIEAGARVLTDDFAPVNAMSRQRLGR